MTVDGTTLRDAMRFWSSGVSVVATVAEKTSGFKYAGMTVSSFTSLSLEPPLTLISIAKETTTASAILASKIFSVSILSGDQAYLGDRFSGRIKLPSHGDRFEGIAIDTAVTGAPYLRDALAWIDCRVHAVYDGSTHWIITGEVQATGHKDDSVPPLVYFNRAYGILTPESARS